MIKVINKGNTQFIEEVTNNTPLFRMPIPHLADCLFYLKEPQVIIICYQAQTARNL